MNIFKKVNQSPRLKAIKSKANKLRQELKTLSRKRKVTLKEEIRKLAKKTRATKKKATTRKRRRY